MAVCCAMQTSRDMLALALQASSEDGALDQLLRCVAVFQPWLFGAQRTMVARCSSRQTRATPACHLPRAGRLSASAHAPFQRLRTSVLLCPPAVGQACHVSKGHPQGSCVGWSWPQEAPGHCGTCFCRLHRHLYHNAAPTIGKQLSFCACCLPELLQLLVTSISILSAQHFFCLSLSLSAM